MYNNSKIRIHQHDNNKNVFSTQNLVPLEIISILLLSNSLVCSELQNVFKLITRRIFHSIDINLCKFKMGSTMPKLNTITT